MEVNINHTWKKYINSDFEKDYFKNLMHFIKEEYKTKKCFPNEDKIFEAFNYCTFNETKVVILGQDPYHQANQANGLCFSVNETEKKPPSLQNIFKEIKNDIGSEIPINGDLTRWAKQGVLLLNSILTVEENRPGSHKNKGWEIFTDNIILAISENKENVVFLLWGSYAINKESLINQRKHLVLKAAHPSPFSAYRGFYGCNHFSKINYYLQSFNKSQIIW